jgi:hypothetical protein
MGALRNSHARLNAAMSHAEFGSHRSALSVRPRGAEAEEDCEEDEADAAHGGGPRQLARVSMAAFGNPVGGSSKTLLPIATLLSHRIGIARKETSRLSNYHALGSCRPSGP